MIITLLGQLLNYYLECGDNKVNRQAINILSCLASISKVQECSYNPTIHLSIPHLRVTVLAI